MRYILIDMPISLIVIAHNIRSAHNVGSLLRTGEGLGVKKIYFTGYTPYPQQTDDVRLPHLSEKITKQIDKTALGAQNSLDWMQTDDVVTLLAELKQDGYILAGLEQTASSISLTSFIPPPKLALVLGNEVSGIDSELLPLLDYCIEIPMSGLKESFNVVEAATIAMYHCLIAGSEQ